MAARGESFGESPQACPFVALEDDRDARADAPDPRHRCFAEPTPQPRALPHQEAFCLSPGFAACPIFQDWATRAAAWPISPVAVASAATEQLGVFDAVDDAGPAKPNVPAAPVADEAPAFGETLALGEPASIAEPDTDDLPADVGDPGADEQPLAPLAPIPPPVPVGAGLDFAEEDEIPPVPPFLAGRAGAESTVPVTAELGGPLAQPPDRQVEIPPPPRSSIPRGIPSEKVAREVVVPSWEIDGRFGAQPDREPDDDRYGGWLTAIAIVAILALGVAGVIFLPGLLAGGPNRTPSPTATIQPSGVPTASAPLVTPSDALPSVTATPIASGPTAEPTVEVTPRLYRIRVGDSLARIARREGVTVEDILAANPDITNPNHIQVGQLIVIPQPPPTAAP